MRLIQARIDAKKMEIKENEQITFEIIGPEEQRVKCVWLDAEAGLFTVEGESGFHTIDDFQQKDPQVQNMKVEVKI